jgi:hypothetical protein
MTVKKHPGYDRVLPPEQPSLSTSNLNMLKKYEVGVSPPLCRSGVVARGPEPGSELGVVGNSGKLLGVAPTPAGNLRVLGCRSQLRLEHQFENSYRVYLLANSQINSERVEAVKSSGSGNEDKSSRVNSGFSRGYVGWCA